MKNKALILSLFLLISLLMASLPVSISAAVTPETSWYDASKSEFTLTTAAQLAGWSKLSNDDEVTFEGKTIKIGAKIEFNTGDASTWGTTAPANEWTPVKDFAGTLDGQNFTISGLYVNTSNSKVGLIGSTDGDIVVKNLAIKNSYFKSTFGTEPSDQARIGSFVGIVANGTSVFENLYSDATVTATTGRMCGGIVGFIGDATENSFVKCVFDGTASSKGYTGGILGYHNKKAVNFTDCINLGKVTTPADAGGMTSRIVSANVVMTRCVNIGEIEGEDERWGPFVGFLADTDPDPVSKLTFVDCYSVDNIELNQHGKKLEVVGEPAVVTAELLTGAAAATTLEGFNFSKDWTVVEGGYPVPTSVFNILNKKDEAPAPGTDAETDGNGKTDETAPTTSDSFAIFSITAVALAAVVLTLKTRKRVK